MKKTLCLSLLLFTSYVSSMEMVSCKLENKSTNYTIKPSSTFIPKQLGTVKLKYDTNSHNFHVIKDEKKHVIQKYHTDKIVRNIDKKQLKSFLKNGYLSVNQMSDGEYSLTANARLNGGGPIGGVIAYWATKCICYGAILAGLGTATVATGGAVGAVVGAATTGAGVAVTGAAVATTATATIGTTAGVVTGSLAAGSVVGVGATVTAGAIGGAGLAGQAALVTGAAGTAVGAAGVVGGIESLSVAIGTFFGMLPTP